MKRANLQENCDSSAATLTEQKTMTSFGKTRAAEQENYVL